MKKRNVSFYFIAAVIFAATVLLRLNAVMASDEVYYWNGSGIGEGTYDDPWVIVSAEELTMLANEVGQGSSYKGYYFLLGDDISLEGISWTPVGNMEHRFAGTFDGAGHKITGLSLTGGEYCGLFGVLEGEVKNLGVSGSVSGTNYVGGIVGYNLGTIAECFFGAVSEGAESGSVSGNSCVGAIAGYTGYSARIESCSADTRVSCSGSFAGGIAGFADGLRGYTDAVSSLKNENGRRVRRGEIIDCRFSGSVTCIGSNEGAADFDPETGIINNEFENSMFGGIAGASSGYTIKNCVGTGEITGRLLTGGIVGACYNGGLVDGCSSGNRTAASGGSTVKGELLTGGIAGIARNSTISGSSSYGSVYGEKYTGGIVGFTDEYTELDGSASNGITEGIEYTGGITGYIRGSFNAESVTSAGTVNGEKYTGGISGYASDVLSHCVNNASVNGTDYTGIQGSSYTGGIVGYAACGVFFGENGGQIEGERYVGGITGYSGKALSECKNTGSVTGIEDVGGIAGYSVGSVKNCENDGTINGKDQINGSLSGAWGTGGNNVTWKSKHVGGIAGHVKQALSFNTNKGTVCGDGGFVGGIAGEGEGSADNCVNEADVTGGADDVGGIAGKLNGDGISIMNCRNTANTKCASGGICGGIVGITNASLIDCTNGIYGDENITVKGYDFVGGIVGQSGDNELHNCDNYASVYAEQNYCGGIVGGLGGDWKMDTCSSYGTIYAGESVGGIAGRCWGNGHCYNCYNRGQVSGNRYIGGIAGELNGSVIIHDCKGSGKVSGKTYVSFLGGIAGILRDDCKVQGCKCDSNNSVQAYSGTKIGGIAGACLDRTLISDCRNDGIVGGYNEIGGITGNVTDNVQIKRCLNTGEVTAAEALAGDSDYAGGIVAIVGDPEDDSNTPLVVDCVNEGTVKGDTYIGGIAAIYYEGGKVVNCTNKGSVEGTGDYIGGVIGWLKTSYFEGCTNKGSVTFAGNDEYSRIGGVIGVNETADVVNCLNTGSIVGKVSTLEGGIVGHNKGTVRTCTNKGSVASYGILAGGIAGQNDLEVLTCVNEGKVKAGGIVAINYGSVSSCINRGEMYNKYDVGGIYKPVIDSHGVWNDDINDWKLESEYDEKKGGIVSVLASGTVSNCINYGKLGSKKYTGGIVGFMKRGSTISDCTNKGEIRGLEIIGGIVGGIEKNGSEACTIEDCLNDAPLYRRSNKGSDMMGGIAGQVYNATITKCVNKGEVNKEDEGRKSDSRKVGGIVGYAESSNITDCINVGNVLTFGRFADGADMQFTSLGGIVGEAQNNCVIERCRNDASVFGGEKDIVYGDRTELFDVILSVNYNDLDYMRGVGGIVGYCRGTTSIKQCVNNGSVFAKGVMVGGIVGAFIHVSGDDIIEDCYDTGDVMGHSDIGGIAGYIGPRWYQGQVGRYILDSDEGEMFFAHNYCKTRDWVTRPDADAIWRMVPMDAHVDNYKFIYDYGVSSFNATCARLLDDPNFFVKITCGALIGNRELYSSGSALTLLNNYWWSKSSVRALGYDRGSKDGVQGHDGSDYGWYEVEDRFADKKNFKNWNFSEIWEIRDSIPKLRMERAFETYLTLENGWARIYEDQVGGKGSTEPNLSVDTAIYSFQELRALQEAVSAGNSFEGATFYLYCDIDDYTNVKPIGEFYSHDGLEHNKPFKGTFDGLGHSIRNLNIFANSSLNSSSIGLFGYLSGDAVIRNLNVTGVVGEKANYYFHGKYIGGIAGYCDGNSRIENCSFTGDVDVSKNTDDCYAGGIAGYCAYKEKQIYVWPNIDEQISSIENCYHVGKVLINKGYAGGIAGNSEMMTNCYHAGGTVTSGNHEVGGIAGSTSHADKISHCYAQEGSATALVLSGGQQASTTGCAFLSADALKNPESFEGFDFEQVWTMGRDFAYPRFKSAFSRMTLKICDGTGRETTVWYPKEAVVYSSGDFAGNGFTGWNASGDGYSSFGLDRYLEISNLYGLSRAREGLTVYGRYIEGEQYGTTFNVSGYGQTEFGSEEYFIPSGITLIGNSNYEAKVIKVTLEAKDSVNGRWETIAAGLNVILPKGNNTQANVSFESGNKQYCYFRLTLSPVGSSTGLSLSGVKLWNKDAQSVRSANVTLYTDGEDDGIGTQNSKIGQTITLPYNYGYRNGYIFTGWNTEADGSGNFCEAGASYTVTGDTCFYAEWIPENLPAARNLVYNGTEQELIYPGVVAVPVLGSEVSAGQPETVTGAGIYYYAAVKNGSPEPAAETFIPQIPSGKEAGVYKVYYRIEGSDTSSGYVLVNMKKKTVTVKATYKTKTEGNADPIFDAEVSGLAEGEPLSIISYTISRTEGEDPGTYALTPAGEAEQGNYKVRYETGQFVIEPKHIDEGETEEGTGGSDTADDDENGNKDVSTYDTGNTTTDNSIAVVIVKSDGSVTERNETRNNDGSITKTEITTKIDGSTVKTETTTNSDGSTVKTEITTNADGSTGKTETTTSADGSITKTETVTNTDGSSMRTETKKGIDGTTETKESIRETDGKTVNKETVVEKDGSSRSISTTMDAKGNVLQTVQGSVTRSENGTVKVTTNTENADGSKLDVVEKTTAKGKVTTKITETDAEGNTTKSTETKNTDGSSAFSSKTVNVDGSTETVKETNNADGSSTFSDKIVNADGSYEVRKETKNSDGSSESETVKVTIALDEETGEKKASITIKKVIQDTDGEKNTFSFAGTREAKGKSLKKAGAAKLKKVKTKSEAVIIPETIIADNKSYKVETIASKAFANNKYIETVQLASYVTVIGKNAFANAKKLCAVELTDSITKIGKGAFEGIAENAVITVKAADKESFERVKILIEASGIGDGVTVVMADGV